MRIGDGEALSSFRATTRNPEIPGHGITQYSRTVWHYSTLCHLQSWAPLRMWGDTVRIGGGEALSSFRATTRNPGTPARDYVNKSPACSLWTPHRVRGDTMRIGDGEALSSFRATTRNPEIPGHGITQDARAMRHYSTLCHLQSWTPHRVRVTQCASGAGRHSRHSALRHGIQEFLQETA